MSKLNKRNSKKLKRNNFFLLLTSLAILLSGCAQELTPQKSGPGLLILSEPTVPLKKPGSRAITQASISEAIPELTSLKIELMDGSDNVLNEMELLNLSEALQLEVTPGEKLTLNGIAYADEETLYNGNVEIEPFAEGESRNISITLTPTVSLGLSIPESNQNPDNPSESAKLPVGKSQTLKIDNMLDGLIDNTVVWYVNGIEGGNETVGTINAEGVYTPPEQLPESPEVIIKATPQKAPSFGTEVKIVLEEETPPEPTIEQIQFRESNGSMLVDQTQQLSLETLLSDQSVADIPDSETISWVSSNEDVLTIDENGLITTLKTGNSTITATVLEKSTDITITVSEPQENQPTLTAIQINNPPSNLILDATVQLQLNALYDDNTSIDITQTETITWSSNDEQVLEVSTTGFVTTKATGAADITVNALGVETKITVNVSNPVNRIALNNPPTNLIVNDILQLRLDAIYENGVTNEITDTSTINWVSSKPDILEVSLTGQITAKQNGEVDINVEALGKQASIHITISNPVLSLIQLNDPPTHLEVDETYQLHLNAVYENNEIVDITNTETINWSSSNEQVLIVNPQGLLTALSPGTITLKANSLNNETSTEIIVNNPPSPITDTDGDGLSDEDETEIYKTLPNNPDSDGDTFYDGHEIAAGTDPSDVNNFPSGTVIEKDLDVFAGVNQVKWQLENAPYLLEQSITIPDGKFLTIEPGVVVKANSVAINVSAGGTLLANGGLGKNNKVIFTSIKDDSINGDSNDDGITTVAEFGDWNNINYFKGGLGSIQHVEIRYAGAGGNGSIKISSSTVTLDDVTIDQSSGHGLRIVNASPSIDNVTISNARSYGIYLSNNANVDLFPIFSNITITDSGNRGLYISNSDESAIVSPTFTDLQIINPGHHGIHIRNTRDTATLSPIFNVSNINVNRIEDVPNNYAVIEVEGVGANPIISDFVVDGGKYGLSLNDGAQGSYNNIESNNAATAGVYLSNNSEPSVFTGIKVDYSPIPLALNGQLFPVTDVLAGLSYGPNTSSQYITLSGTLRSGEHILSSDPLKNDKSIWLVEGLTIEAGVTLSITPGTVVKFNSSIVVRDRGTFNIIGEENNPIILTSFKDDSVGGDSNGDENSTTAAPGDWNNINYFKGGLGSIRHVELRYAGSGGNGSIHISSATVTLDNVTIDQSSSHGLRIVNASPSIDNVTISNARSYGIYLSNNENVDLSPTFTNITITDSGNTGLYIFNSDEFAIVSPTFTDLQIFNPGRHGIYIRNTRDTANLSPTFNVSNINVNRIEGIPNNSAAIAVHGIGANPTISHFILDGGKYGLSLNDGAQGSYDNIESNNAVTAGVYLSNNSEPSVFTGIKVDNTPIPLALNDQLFPVTDILAGLSYGTNTSSNYITLSGTLRSGDHILSSDPLKNGNSVWLVEALTIEAGVTLSITPGTVVKLNSGVLVRDRGTFNIIGEENNPIILTSFKDDSVGGDSNGDDNSTTAAPGDWNNINYFKGSLGSIQHVEIKYAGAFGNGSIYISSSTVTLDDVTIDQSSSFGLRIVNASPSIANATISNAQSYGIYLSNNTNVDLSPTFTDLQIINPGSHGIYITNTSDTANLSPIFNVSNINVNRIEGVPNNYAAIAVHGIGANPTISHFILDGGKYGLSLNDGAQGSYDNIESNNAVTAGVYLSNNSEPDSFTEMTISNTPIPLELNAQGLPTNIDLPDGFIYGVNTSNQFVKLSGIFYKNEYTLFPDPLGNSNSVWLFDRVTIQSDAILTINENTIVKFDSPQSYLWIYGQLNVSGTQDNEVIFTSFTDDSFVGDSNGDDSTTIAEAGDWGYIWFDKDSGGDIQHAELHYSGTTSYASIFILSDNVVVDSLLINQSLYNALEVRDASPTLTNIDLMTVSTSYDAIKISGSTSDPTLENFNVEGGRFGLALSNNAAGNYLDLAFTSAAEAAIYLTGDSAPSLFTGITVSNTPSALLLDSQELPASIDETNDITIN